MGGCGTADASRAAPALRGRPVIVARRDSGIGDRPRHPINLGEQDGCGSAPQGEGWKFRTGRGRI